MMNNLQHFKNGNIDLPIKVTENGEVEFDAEQAAIGLGISQTAKSGNKVARWERVNKYLSSPQVGMQISKDDFITEPQFYKLAIKANNETAERFQDWVTEEVLPSIRKHGAYMTSEKIEEALTNPDTIIKLATDLKKEQQNRIAAEKKIEEDKPKVSYYDHILSNKSLCTITAIAKDYGMSGSAMNKKLHELKVQFPQSGMWFLYSKYQHKGWTHSETHMIPKDDGTEKAVMNTKWTQKGRLGVYKILKDHGILPLIEQGGTEDAV
jgi:prophage antirepressor-like protein